MHHLVREIAECGFSPLASENLPFRLPPHLFNVTVFVRASSRSSVTRVPRPAKTGLGVGEKPVESLDHLFHVDLVIRLLPEHVRDSVPGRRQRYSLVSFSGWVEFFWGLLATG